MAQNLDIAQFAKDQVSGRLGKLAFELRKASQSMDADNIHDLRVAIRRFGQSLAVFESLLPAEEVKKVRKRLRRLMDAAGEIRDRDIACGLLDAPGAPENDGIRKLIVRDRHQAELDLRERIKRWNRKDFSAKWRAGLQLNQS